MKIMNIRFIDFFFAKDNSHMTKDKHGRNGKPGAILYGSSHADALKMKIKD